MRIYNTNSSLMLKLSYPTVLVKHPFVREQEYGISASSREMNINPDSSQVTTASFLSLDGLLTSA